MTTPKGFVILNYSDTYRRINTLRDRLDTFRVAPGDSVAKKYRRQMERELALHFQINTEREENNGYSQTAATINADRVTVNLMRAFVG